MQKILLQLHDENDSLMFQGFIILGLASAEVVLLIFYLLSYQSALVQLKEDLSILFFSITKTSKNSLLEKENNLSNIRLNQLLSKNVRPGFGGDEVEGNGLLSF